MLLLAKGREMHAFKKIQEGGKGKKWFVLAWVGVFNRRGWVLLYFVSLILTCVLVISFILYGQQSSSRVQMTEDELIIHFFQFDGNFCYFNILCVCVCV